MKTWLAKWPNGSISVVRAKSETEAYWLFDEEGSPTHAQIYEITSSNFHIKTNVTPRKRQKPRINVHFGEETTKKKVKFTSDIMWESLGFKIL